MANNNIKKLIKECLNEVLQEATGSVNVSSRNPVANDPNYIKRYTQQGLNVNLTEKGNIKEMARIATTYQLAPDYEEKLEKLDPRLKNSKWVQGIIEYLNEVGEAKIIDIAKNKFDRPQQSINMLVLQQLLPAGVMMPSSGQKFDRFQQKEKARAAAEEAGEEFDEDEFDVTSPRKSLSTILDPADFFVGSDFDDDFDDGILSFDDEGKPVKKQDIPNAGKSDSSIPQKDARTAAAEFFIDDDNDNILRRIINAQQMGGKRPMKENADDKDYVESEKKKVIAAKNSIDGLIQQYVDKIKGQPAEVQKEILNMLTHKLPGASANLYKKISNALGQIPVEDTPVSVNNEPYNEDTLTDDEADQDYFNTDALANELGYTDEQGSIDEIEGSDEELDESIISRFQTLGGIKK